MEIYIILRGGERLNKYEYYQYISVAELKREQLEKLDKENDYSIGILKPIDTLGEKKYAVEQFIKRFG